MPPTDCDVYFRRRMKLIDWGSPLPTALGLGCAPRSAVRLPVAPSSCVLPRLMA